MGDDTKVGIIKVVLTWKLFQAVAIEITSVNSRSY